MSGIEIYDIGTWQRSKDLVEVSERVALNVGVNVGQAAAEVRAQHREQWLYAQNVNLGPIQLFL
jgi:hypothetical protein